MLFLTFLYQYCRKTNRHATVRVILFRSWIESTDTPAVPSPSDVLYDQYVGTQSAPMAFLNPDNTGTKTDRTRRIEILKNQFVSLDTSGSQLAQDIEWNVEMNGPSRKNKDHIKFESSSTASPISGGLYCLLISDQVDASEMSANFVSKLTYYDN